MIVADAIPAHRAALPAPVTQPRSGAETYVAGLKDKHSIGPEQMGLWSAFAEALSSNDRRMRSNANNGDEPFGALPDRLAALESMRQAAEQLFGVLGPTQRGVAAQVLPLCCLPRAAGFAWSNHRPQSDCAK